MTKHHAAAAIDRTVRDVLKDVLALDHSRVAAFDDGTPLFGALPELDSMAVAGVLTELEDRLGILIEDDEVDGEMLETFGALRRFAERKVAS
ncbi:MAG: acyl carrier protein [Proteobacteria bacterium]|nr:acyl carrier protein [Pseudomonadota bacterium]